MLVLLGFLSYFLYFSLSLFILFILFLDSWYYYSTGISTRAASAVVL